MLLRTFQQLFCLLVVCGWLNAADTVDTQPYVPPVDPSADWERVTPADLGISHKELAAIDSFLSSINTHAFIMLHRGRILHEAYYNGANASSSGPVFSVSKTMVAYLTVRCQEAGLLKLEEPVLKYLGKGWSRASGEQEEQILIRHLITMTSGLDEKLKYVGPAGSIWHYNSTTYHKLHELLTVVTKKTHQEFSQELLFDVIGMQSRWNFNNSRIICNGRDMARFGLLLLRQGDWEGKEKPANTAQLFEELWTPSQSLNPSYAFLTWLNNDKGYLLPQSSDLSTKPLWPDAPSDLFAAMGKNDKRIYVIPSMDLVIIRHGEKAYNARLTKSKMDAELWSRLKPVLVGLKK